MLSRRESRIDRDQHLDTVVVLSNPKMRCLTFYQPAHPKFWVGYRILEGPSDTARQPLPAEPDYPTADWGVFPTPPMDKISLVELSLPRKRWRTTYQEKDHRDKNQLMFQTFIDGSAWCKLNEFDGHIQREFIFRPVEDGIQIWMRLTTQVPLQQSYLVQQCLRFTGAQNWSMRRQTAFVPFLSELDVQAMGHPNLSLTYVRQGDVWINLPANQAVYSTHTAQNPPESKFNGVIDHGLIIRETLNRQVVPKSYFRKTAPGETWDRITSGMYWERTARVSNRHPADCIHAVVDFGPISAGESRTLRGKFYWIEGTKEDLLTVWQRDFQH